MLLQLKMYVKGGTHTYIRILNANYVQEPHVNQHSFIFHTAISIQQHTVYHWDLYAATENCMKCGFSYETDC